MPGEHLDISSESSTARDAGLSASNLKAVGGAGQGGRPFVGMHFTCCDIYTRIYLNTERTMFFGHCPRCGRRVQIKVSPDGSDSRFFTAS
jgi:hypothetical protein